MAEHLVVADTDLVIDFLRGKGVGAAVVREHIGAGTLRLTAVTAYELRVGTDFHDRHGEVLRLLRRRTLPLDMAAALRGGEVSNRLRAKGVIIGVKDCLTAGICLRFDLPLATHNRKHFERVDGLELVELPGDS